MMLANDRQAARVRDNDTMIAKFRSRFLHLASSKSLSARAMQSSVWVAMGFAGQRGLQFVSNLILTRLLFPEAFGLMALVTVFLVGLAMFSDIGLRPAVIRERRSCEPDFLNTAWTIQVIRGFCLFGAGCALAYPVSYIYDQEILFPLLIVVSSTAAISGFQTIGLATSERDLDFLRPTLIALSGQIVGIVVLILLAWCWGTVWALAVGNVIGSIATVTIGHIVLRSHRHRILLEPEAARSIVSFGRWIMLSTIVTFIGGEGLRALQAGLLTIAEFGVLSIAYTIALIASDLPAKLTGSVGLPALVEAHRSGPDRLAHVLWQVRRRVLIVAIPMTALVALMSGPMIKMLYDDRYQGAASYVLLLSGSNFISVVYAGYTTALLAMGRSKSYLCVMSFQAIARISGVYFGFLLSGVYGMLLGLAVANLIILILIWNFRDMKEISSFWQDTLSITIVTCVIFAITCQYHV